MPPAPMTSSTTKPGSSAPVQLRSATKRGLPTRVARRPASTSTSHTGQRSDGEPAAGIGSGVWQAGQRRREAGFAGTKPSLLLRPDVDLEIGQFLVEGRAADAQDAGSV